ncbi:DUF3768 domain-containing protein [Palleronia caenipelagi]|uniref:DUF3768 domain-containing protein n=1 Tax=Palleronia caenipelagi TaxID=2489174 RepID=A0A547PT33_9RHOB|nr:DUF3768 domain-containing protein [Palleronia caenipelagi]TRD17300.1 DUF3768 domain-containing protein [Palleronia caenipelagi]
MTDTLTEIDPRKVASQNDAFRRHVCLGAAWPEGIPALEGQMVMTPGVRALGRLAVEACRPMVGRAAEFDPDNDPDGYHDFGAVEVFGTKVWWKLDAHDRNYAFGSDDPSDPDQTARVLTLLLPGEW